ncbi:STAS domain-containing protein [Actinoplanes sp. NPDC023801]|uniref:STAS domain-containing protein n=1 Tax=Actinoplanes sp. NPDC023801 TaxID=3154595 RepID=UPI0034113047
MIWFGDTPALCIIAQPVTAQRLLRLVLTGELDVISAADLRKQLSAGLTTDQPAAVELDLAAVTFLDAAGVRCLIDCLHDVERAGCTFAVIDPSDAVRQVLRISGLIGVLGVR